MFIELTRDGKVYQLREKLEGKAASPIAHVETSYYPEAVALAQAEAKRRGANWSVVNKVEESRP